MAFFTKYNGTTNARLARMETWTWVLIYGGLLAAVLGMFIEKSQEQSGSAFFTVGGLSVLTGIVLVILRSRMHDDI
jgi:uncharacterized membrane protein YhaH (DUF805 family)